MYSGRTQFSASKFNKVAVSLAFLFFAAISIFTYLYQAWSIWSFGLVALCLLALAGVADAFSSYLTLNNESIEFRRNMIKKIIEKSAIEKASRAKGCPAFLLLKDGTKLELPALEEKAISSSINAWLKQS